MIIQGGVNKKVSLSTILGSLDSSNNIVVNPNSNSISMTVKSNASPYLLTTNQSSGNNVSIKVAPGSTDPTVDLHVNNNVKYGGILRSSSDNMTAPTNSVPTSVSLITETTLLNTTNSAYNNFSVAAGTEGQIKHLVWHSDTGGTSSINITFSSLLGGPTNAKIVMSKGGTQMGQSVVLKYTASKWICLSVSQLTGTIVLT